MRHLLEAAIASEQAASQELALYRKHRGNYITYVLYDPSAFEYEFEAGESKTGDVTRVIFGFLEVRPHEGECWDAGEIAASAAQKGYGPLMYELAMSDFHILTSDRSSTSASARKVWNVYDQRSDVKKLAFDNEDNPKTPPTEDDCKIVRGSNVAFLNQAYSGEGDSGAKAQLIQNHIKALIDIASSLNINKREIEDAIHGMAVDYFLIRYGE